MVVFHNFMAFRSGDIMTVLFALYTVISTVVIGQIDSPWKSFVYIAQPLFWRIIHTVLGGVILYSQSTRVSWTKLFIKRGFGLTDAFQSWKVLYNLGHTMMYVSFLTTAIRVYHIPSSFTLGGVFLRHLLGLVLCIDLDFYYFTCLGWHLFV